MISDRDLARWARLSRRLKANPKILTWLSRHQPDTYRAIVDGLRTVAMDISDAAWRDSRDGFGGRPEQLLPGTPGSFSDRTDWRTWLLMGGRGSGKSRTGAEATREMILGRQWHEPPRWCLLGQTLEAVRTEMVEATLLEVLPRGSIAQWRRSTVDLILTNGAHLKGYTSESPLRLRGPNFHGAWVDELSQLKDADRSPAAVDTSWSNLQLAVRAHDHHTWTPRIITTTTPKARRILRNPDPTDPENPGDGLHDLPTTVISTMSTLDNLAHLPDTFVDAVIRPLEGTRLWDQEVLGLLVDVDLGALWTAELIEQMTRPSTWPWAQAGGLDRIVIGCDPSVGTGQGSECGIIVAGRAADGRAYVLEDCSLRGTPPMWVEALAGAYERWGADAVIVEKNHGEELISETIGRYAPNLPIVTVRAKRGKHLRAEPVALLSDQDRVRLAWEPPQRKLSFLTYQMRTWSPEEDADSPDRLDAFVYAILDLLPVFGISELVSFSRRRSRL